MRLKRVRIFGFKTFADRTEFDLQGGIVAVVGPNGCGKSNLVDAMLWGLGESNVRQLRAQTSQDVIFGGSTRRKPVGYAEVQLLFDNEDGALPIDTGEVVISRKLNRAGESEYAINRTPCRQRDVFELLADSGLGRAGYSIVGQKEIDQALAASAEDRRSWVDEAAGVQRYRARKIEALRRLTQATVHLERVTDILNEIENQREPLREEAEVAIRYKSVLTSLREVESGLLIVEIAKAVQEINSSAQRITDSQTLIDKETELANAADAEAELLTSHVRKLESEADHLRQAQQEAAMAMERAHSAIRLAEQKHQTLVEFEQNLGEESTGFRNRLEEAVAEYKALQEEIVLERERRDAIAEESTGATAETAAITAELTKIESDLALARESHARRLRHEAERAHADERIKAIRRELKGVDAALPDLEKGVADAEAAFAAAHLAGKTLDDSGSELSRRLQELSANERSDDVQKRAWLAEVSTLEGRRQGLEMSIDAHEGLTQGARAVMEAAKQGMLPDIYRPVGEAIETETDYALAVETALGNSANDLIVPHQEDAKRAIDLLKSGRLGRATFQPIPLMRPPEITNDLKRLLGERGVIGRASELVSCQAAHRPVIDSLLGRVVVVETLDDALRMARTTGWSRMVTLEGEVLHSSGAVTGGQSAKQGYGLVQRKADLADLERREGELTGKLAEIAARAKKRETQRAEIEAQLAVLLAKRKEQESEIAETREWLHSLRDELVSTQRARTKLDAELAQLSQLTIADAAPVDIAAVEAERDRVLKLLAAKSADTENAEARLIEAEQRMEQAELRKQLGEKRLLAMQEQDRLRSRKLDNLGPEKYKAEQEIAQGRKEREAAEARRTHAERELADLQSRRTFAQEKQQAALEQGRKSRQNIAGLQDSTHQQELARARADARRTTAVQRLIEEYGLSEEEALTQASAINVPADAASLVSRLRRELKAMGDVNLGAVEAYERLTERSTELTSQKADVEEGITDIRGAVRELDKLTRDRFINTFNQLEIAFTEIFAKLFGGVEGKISLSDPDNILESGIEIDVTLPGKKKQRLELLSGGERSLCATAFLFALLQVKPSPLVVLDEVDAPLDGRNVERFVQLLKEFSDRMQFIIITHNPTTIESCPIWLGVTMQEPGVSMLIPSRVAATSKIAANSGVESV